MVTPLTPEGEGWGWGATPHQGLRVTLSSLFTLSGAKGMLPPTALLLTGVWNGALVPLS